MTYIPTSDRPGLNGNGAPGKIIRFFLKYLLNNKLRNKIKKM